MNNSKYTIDPIAIAELFERLNVQIPYGPYEPFRIPEIPKFEPYPPEVQAQMDILHERYVSYSCYVDENNIVHIIDAEEE